MNCLCVFSNYQFFLNVHHFFYVVYFNNNSKDDIRRNLGYFFRLSLRHVVTNVTQIELNDYLPYVGLKSSTYNI